MKLMLNISYHGVKYLAGWNPPTMSGGIPCLDHWFKVLGTTLVK